MNKTTAKITGYIIDECQPNNPCNCAIYHALKNEYPGYDISVSLENINIHTRHTNAQKNLQTGNTSY